MYFTFKYVKLLIKLLPHQAFCKNISNTVTLINTKKMTDTITENLHHLYLYHFYN